MNGIIAAKQSLLAKNAHLVVLFANVFAILLEVGPDEVLVALVALHLLLLLLLRLARRRRFLLNGEKRNKRDVQFSSTAVPPSLFLSFLSLDR